MINPKFSNEFIIDLLKRIATVYEIEGKPYFRTQAYYNLIDQLHNYPHSLYSVWKKNPKALDNIPGVGEAILKKLNYLFTHGQIYPPTKRLLAKYSESLFALVEINGIGPKIAHTLTQNFTFPKSGQAIFTHLIDLCRQDKISQLPRFGAKSQSLILQNTLNHLRQHHRISLTQAQVIAQDIINFLRLQFPQATFLPLGSLRRQLDTIGDIDIACKSDKALPILQIFTTYPDTIQILSLGSKKASILLKNYFRVDLMVQSATSWGSLLVHFTGSRQHNIKLRQYALKLGFSLSEYGIRDNQTDRLHTFSDEESFYQFLGLRFIPPEQRLGTDEISSAIIKS